MILTQTFNTSIKCSQMQQSEIRIITSRTHSLLSVNHSILTMIASQCCISTFEVYLSIWVNWNHSYITYSTVPAVTETWINENSVDRFCINSYQHESWYRNERKGGGVSLFIRQNLSYITLNDVSICNESIESLFVELVHIRSSPGKSIIIGVVYRPPNTEVTVFNEVMEDLLHKLRLNQKAIYILGDYNITLLNCDMHQSSGNFLEIMFSHSLIPFINRPTRETANSATIIDNIYSNEIQNDQLSGILYTNISDHFPIFIIDYSCTTYDQSQYIVKRHYTCDNI